MKLNLCYLVLNLFENLSKLNPLDILLIFIMAFAKYKKKNVLLSNKF